MCLIFSLYVIFCMFPETKLVPFRENMPKSKRHSEMKPGKELSGRQVKFTWVLHPPYKIFNFKPLKYAINSIGLVP